MTQYIARPVPLFVCGTDAPYNEGKSPKKPRMKLTVKFAHPELTGQKFVQLQGLKENSETQTKSNPSPCFNFLKPFGNWFKPRDVGIPHKPKVDIFHHLP